MQFEPGAVYGVPLPDASFGLAQAIGRWMPGTTYCAVFACRSSERPQQLQLTLADVISLPAVTSLDGPFSGWPRWGTLKPIVRRTFFPNERFADQGYVGAKIYEPPIIAAFLAAFHGLSAWDDWHDPHFLDQLLISAALKPSNLIYKHV